MRQLFSKKQLGFVSPKCEAIQELSESSATKQLVKGEAAPKTECEIQLEQE